MPGESVWKVDGGSTEVGVDVELIATCGYGDPAKKKSATYKVHFDAGETEKEIRIDLIDPDLIERLHLELVNPRLDANAQTVRVGVEGVSNLYEMDPATGLEQRALLERLDEIDSSNIVF